MEDIPVTFDFNGKEYSGHLSQVSGAGASGMYHLNVNGYYWGQLWYVQAHPGFNDGLHAEEAGWRFGSNQHQELSEQAEYFGYVVAAWIDSHF